MPTPGVEEFAKVLIECIRDPAVRGCDVVRQGPSPKAKRWREAMNDGPQQAAHVMIPDCVDETIFRLLHAIDEGAIRLQFVSQTGTVVDLAEQGDGELAGWYMMTEGWRDEHCKERFADDVADLELHD